MRFMNRNEFKKKLRNLKLSQKKFSELMGYSYSAVKGWDITPCWVEYVLGYLEISQHINEIGSLSDSVSSLKEKVQKLDFKYLQKN